MDGPIELGKRLCVLNNAGCWPLFPHNESICIYNISFNLVRVRILLFFYFPPSNFLLLYDTLYQLLVLNARLYQNSFRSPKLKPYKFFFRFLLLIHRFGIVIKICIFTSKNGLVSVHNRWPLFYLLFCQHSLGIGKLICIWRGHKR